MVLEKTSESPLDRKIKAVILKEINPEYSLEGLILKLKLQYFGHLMQTVDSLEKSLMLGKTEAEGEQGIRGWDGWMASPMQWTWTWANPTRWWGTGRPGVLQSMGSQRIGHDWETEQQHRKSLLPEFTTYWGCVLSFYSYCNFNTDYSYNQNCSIMWEDGMRKRVHIFGGDKGSKDS